MEKLKAKMKCWECDREELVPTVVDQELRVTDDLSVSIPSVPVLKCDNCGHVFTDAHTEKTMAMFATYKLLNHFRFGERDLPSSIANYIRTALGLSHRKFGDLIEKDGSYLVNQMKRDDANIDEKSQLLLLKHVVREFTGESELLQSKLAEATNMKTYLSCDENNFEEFAHRIAVGH